MLTIVDGKSGSEGLSRRAFLTAGSLGLGGLALPQLLAAAEKNPGLVRGKSVVFLFQQGGPSQFETFDPKPDAPEGIRTVTATAATKVPGVFFGETMNQLASVADKLTVVRSFQTNNAAHNIEPIVAPYSLNANIGVLYSHVVGAIRESGMPTNSVLFPQSVSTKVAKGAARGDISATGTLGSAYAPFIPGAGGQAQKDMRLNLPIGRFEDRRQLLGEFKRLNELFEGGSQAGATDKFQDQAYQLLLSNRVADAFDITKESPATIERYDTSRYNRADNYATARRGQRGYYSGHAQSLGKLMLMARRLCEAGCGFVTVHAAYEGVWDMHADGENLDMIDGMNTVGRSFDHAVAAFIEDLEARGLSDKILLVCCGEMGRTPKLNKNGGRDHWAKLSPLLFYGGGTRPQVLGQSTRDGGEPATEPFGPANLISTIVHTMFDPGQLRLVPRLAAISRLAETKPIPVIG